MSPKRLIWNINEAFRPIPLEDIAKTSKSQDGGRSPKAITWDFVWINHIALNVPTNFQPAINFVQIIT